MMNSLPPEITHNPTSEPFGRAPDEHTHVKSFCTLQGTDFLMETVFQREQRLIHNLHTWENQSINTPVTMGFLTRSTAKSYLAPLNSQQIHTRETYF